jgi:UDP-N-acetylglucosamine acyltransferase
LPPFTIALRDNEICGLNIIGLRRAGFNAEERLELKRVYHSLFSSGQNLRSALAKAAGEFQSGPAKTLVEFVAAARRGVCADVRAARVPLADSGGDSADENQPV